MRSMFLVNVAVASLSAILAVAILACSAHALSTFNSSQASDVWLLPVWRDHFDIRDLELAVATSVVIALLNLGYLISVAMARVGHPATLKDSTPNTKQIPSASINTTLAALSASVALVAVIFPAVMNNNKSPYTDTLRTWTCGWNSMMDIGSNGGPESSFATMCNESRFAFYTIIPVFVLQLCLLVCSVYTPIASRRRAQSYGQGAEKSYSLDSQQRRASWDVAQSSVKTNVVEQVRPVAA